MINKKLSLIAIATCAALITACDGDNYNIVNEPKDDNVIQITEADVKNNYVTMAYAAYSDSLTTAQALQTAITQLLANPSEANLQIARAAYKDARVPYQQSEILRWDTAITIDKDLANDGGPASVDEWEGQVNAWPLDENHIDSIIEGSDSITTELLIGQNGANDNEANVTTGVHAIEYLLWGRDFNGTGPGAGERPASDFDVVGCLDSFCQRRSEYLTTVTNLLVSDLTAMKSEWSPTATTTPNTLSYNFVNSDLALDYILGSILTMATDELAGARMNSGLLLGDPEEEHDCFSDLSHLAIYHNFQGIKNAFYGTYGDLSGAGIGDLIKDADVTTYNTIDTALQSIEGHMSQILEFGERETNPIHFDQIIGQGSNEPEREVAQAAVNELIYLDAELRIAAEALSLNSIDLGAGGDGD